MTTPGNKPPLVPTGSCFDDALAFIIENMARPGDARGLSHLRLVHGICVMSDGLSYAHAWVEDSHPSHPVPLAWQGSVVRGEPVWFAMAISDFHLTYEVSSFTRYTYEQAVEENKLTGHLGPWREEYLALTAEAGMGGSSMTKTKHGVRVLKMIPRTLVL